MEWQNFQLFQSPPLIHPDVRITAVYILENGISRVEFLSENSFLEYNLQTNPALRDLEYIMANAMSMTHNIPAS